MARNWAAIRADLLHGGGVEFNPPPGRIFLVGPRHTFAGLAKAIDQAFARWDLGHLHAFELGDGRRIGMPEGEWDKEFEDETLALVMSSLGQGDRFAYISDFGDDWTHSCLVERDNVDPQEEYGEEPSTPVPIAGWGWIPDQYGRESSAEDE